MQLGAIKRLLKLWTKAGLINEEASSKIMDYMKIRRRDYFFRLIKILFVLGAFWLVVGIVATLKLIDVKILLAIWHFIEHIFSPIVNFLIKISKWIAGENYGYFLTGLVCSIGWGVFHWFGKEIRERSNVEMVKLGFLADSDLRLGTTSLTIGYILASVAFQVFNYLIYPPNVFSNYYWGHAVIVPYFSFLAVVFFLYIAYRMKDQIALLFAIGFLGHSVGFFTAYYFACYVIGVQLPVIQALLGVLLLLIGFWHFEKFRGRKEDYFHLFARTYQWTGLLFIYMSVWIMSLWGFTYEESYWRIPSAVELWLANLLFLATCLGALFYGAMKEDRLFFNFGLTFFIIDTYTLFFSRVWSTVGTALGSLLLGSLLVGTGYALRKLFLEKKI